MDDKDLRTMAVKLALEIASDPTNKITKIERIMSDAKIIYGFLAEKADEKQ